MNKYGKLLGELLSTAFAGLLIIAFSAAVIAYIKTLIWLWNNINY